MNAQQHPGFRGPAAEFARGGAAAAVLLGLTVLAGWALDVGALKSILPGLVTMKPNTAFGLVLAGLGLWLLVGDETRRAARWIGYAAASLTALLGVLTLSQFGFGWDLGIDQRLFREPAMPLFTTNPGRMSPLTALNFAALGAALLSLHARRVLSASQSLALLTGMISLVIVIAYVFGARAFSWPEAATPMAPHTAFGFLVLATGVLAATADRGLLSAYRRHLPPLAMFAALVLLLLAGAGAFRNARRMAETSAWVARTYQELALMEGILAGVQDIGAAHRGFVATGMETFLAPVAAARDALTRDLAALRLLSADSPEQERRVAALQPLITSRLAHAAETERLFRTRGAAAARAFIAAGAGERLVSGIRALVHDMKRSEEQLLNQRRADAAATTASSFLALGLAAAIGMAVLVGLFAALYRLNHALESRVAERTAALAASERQYRDVAETALVGIYRSTLRGDVLYVNKAMARMVGFDSPEAMIRSGALARWRNPEDRRAFLERLQRDGQVEASENVILTARGEPIHTLVSATIKGDELTGTVLDITERKRTEQEISTLNAELEQRVRDRTRQLEEVNSELESFSYSVSHDLRAPLRHIDGYAEMLEHTTDGQLTEQAQRYLRTIREASAEMGQLIDDLLAFARMGRAELHESCVHLNELVQEAIRGMEMATAGRNITWYVAPLPQVVGDQALLKQVLANLIGNAVKYSRTRDPARIEIGSAGEENGRVIVFVRDNGVGFDMQHADRLFGVFQRLHRAEEFEGTGVGLATVRRIVARHGGRVWAESAVNQGATFHFTLQRSRSA